MKLEHLVPIVYVTWQTPDGLIHVAWQVSTNRYADYHTSCAPMRPRTPAYGRRVDHAPTCVPCVAGRR